MATAPAPISAPVAPGIPGAATVQAAPNNGSSAPASTSSPSLLVSSSQAQGQYNSAVSNMQKAQANTTPIVSTVKPVDTNLYAQPGENYAAYSTRVGAYQTAQNAAQNGTATDPKQNNPSSSTPSSTPDTSGTPSTSSSDSGTSPIDTTGLDPHLSKAYNDSIDAMTQQMNDVQSTITAAKATAANDPALQAALDALSNKYSALITDAQNKNKILLGNANTSMAAFGGLGPMSQSFLSDEVTSANARVQSLQSEEDNLKLQTQISYQQKNAKAVTDLQAQYDKLNVDKTTAIKDLLAAVSKQQADNKAADLAAQAQSEKEVMDKQTIAHQNLQDQISSIQLGDKEKQDAIQNAFQQGQISETQRHNLASELTARVTATRGHYQFDAATGTVFDTSTGKVVETAPTNIFNGTVTPGKTGNVLLDANTTATSSGVPYVDGTNFTGAQASSMQLAAAKAGIPYVGKDAASALDSIATTKTNLAGMSALVSKLAPSDALNALTLGTDRLITTGVHAAERLTQVGTGATDIGTFDTYHEAAIKAIQALASGGTGLRINQAEINQMMNNLPSYNDTKSIADGKIKILTGMLDSNEKNIVGPDAYSKFNPTPEDTALSSFLNTPPSSTQPNPTSESLFSNFVRE